MSSLKKTIISLHHHLNTLEKNYNPSILLETKEIVKKYYKQAISKECSKTDRDNFIKEFNRYRIIANESTVHIPLLNNQYKLQKTYERKNKISIINERIEEIVEINSIINHLIETQKEGIDNIATKIQQQKYNTENTVEELNRKLNNKKR
ncbi:hypothetical protein SLOPH_2304, partial [Spraguea lophii 42_110]